VGGALRSKHMDGAAFDIAMVNHDPIASEAAARAVGFLGFGFYPRSGFMHIDLGPARQWGERFPVRAIAFAEETPPAREVLAESRTMKGSGAAGVATLGAAGMEVAQNVLGGDAVRHPAARALSRHAALGVHRRRTRGCRRDDLRPHRRLEAGAAMIIALLTGLAASPWVRATLRYGAIAVAVLLFLLALRRSGERAGRIAERLETAEKANEVQCQMLDAAARRPRNRDDLADRLRDGRF
jgi:hypothetical protein